MEQLPCLLEDETITTFENGKNVDEVREVIIDCLTMNVSVSKVTEEIPTVLKKLGGKSIARLPSKAFNSHVQLGRAILKEADPSRVIGNTFMEMVQPNIIYITKILKLPLHTAKHIQFFFSHTRDMLINSFSHLLHQAYNLPSFILSYSMGLLEQVRHRGNHGYL